jgi:hypothetical protein
MDLGWEPLEIVKEPPLDQQGNRVQRTCDRSPWKLYGAHQTRG